MTAEMITVQLNENRLEEAVPSVMLTMPFDPKMTDRRMIEQGLSVLIGQALEQMETRFPKAHIARVYQKLTRLSKQLEYSTHKISLAIMVSPDFEKVYYLNFPVQEQVTIGDTFDFRKLAMQKKAEDKFLLMMLSENRLRICLADEHSVTPLVLGHPRHIDLPQRVGNFSDPEKVRELRLDKFLVQSDHSLRIILHAYDYPLVVMGCRKTIGRFRQLSKHSRHIAEVITGNFDDSSPSELLRQLKKVRIDTLRLREKHNLLLLANAQEDRKLATGIQECSQAAYMGNARLLIVEKGYQVTTFITSRSDLHEVKGLDRDSRLPLKDLVDSTIEKVLQNGGEVEFVEDGVLKDFMHMAVVRRY